MKSRETVSRIATFYFSWNCVVDADIFLSRIFPESMAEDLLLETNLAIKPSL